MTVYVVQRRTVITEHGDIEADSLEGAWELYEESPHDLLDYSDGDTEASVQIVEDVKYLNPTGWDEASCPRCGDNECIEVEDQTGTHEFFTAWANCCSVQWCLFDLASAAKCDPAWKDVG
jgi:hypothetical protein